VWVQCKAYVFHEPLILKSQQKQKASGIDKILYTCLVLHTVNFITMSSLSIRNILVLVFGVVFTLVALLGFLGNDPVLGLFEVDLLHNLVHLVSGLAAFACFRSESLSAMYGKVMGAVYGLVTILGFFSTGSILGLISINAADNYLHLFLTIGLLVIGFMPMTKKEAKVA
jgi:hypothetical protein